MATPQDAADRELEVLNDEVTKLRRVLATAEGTLFVSAAAQIKNMRDVGYFEPGHPSEITDAKLDRANADVTTTELKDAANALEFHINAMKSAGADITITKAKWRG